MFITVLVDGLCPFFALKICHYEFLARSSLDQFKLKALKLYPEQKGLQLATTLNWVESMTWLHVTIFLKKETEKNNFAFNGKKNSIDCWQLNWHEFVYWVFSLYLNKQWKFGLRVGYHLNKPSGWKSCVIHIKNETIKFDVLRERPGAKYSRTLLNIHIKIILEGLFLAQISWFMI